MTIFTPRDPAATKILSEELEKKIEGVNASMVSARNETEKFQIKKNQLEIDIGKLEEKKEILSKDVASVEEKNNSLFVVFQDTVSQIEVKRAELDAVNKQLREATAANAEETKKFAVEREDIAKRKSDLDGQEAVLRTYAKGLEEKEKKLDIYADRVKKLLDSVKPE